MKYQFEIITVFSLAFLIQLFGCTSCNAISSKEISVADSIVNLQKVALPFEYEEWLNWISDYYSDQGVEDENRFVYYYSEDHTWLNDIYKKSDGSKEITGFSHVFTPLFQILDNGTNDFYSFIVGNGDDGSEGLKLINVNNKGKVLSDLNLSYQDTTSLLKGFRITEDLKIELYEGELIYNNTEKRGIIKNKVLIEKYQLQKDGSLKLFYR